MRHQSAKVDLQANLARNVRAVRAGLGVTKEALAERSGLHQTYVSDVERGRCNVMLDVVTHLAEVLKVSPLELLASGRSEEHTSELQSLMRISYAVFCLKKKKKQTKPQVNNCYKTE